MKQNKQNNLINYITLAAVAITAAITYYCGNVILAWGVAFGGFLAAWAIWPDES